MASTNVLPETSSATQPASRTEFLLSLPELRRRKRPRNEPRPLAPITQMPFAMEAWRQIPMTLIHLLGGPCIALATAGTHTHKWFYRPIRNHMFSPIATGRVQWRKSKQKTTSCHLRELVSDFDRSPPVPADSLFSPRPSASSLGYGATVHHLIFCS